MKFVLIGAAALVAAASATPALAQQVIEDPGYCAQFYPNANCQNLGPGNPFTGAPAGGWRNGYAHIYTGWRKKWDPLVKSCAIYSNYVFWRI